jgi:hypothetical protein
MKAAAARTAGMKTTTVEAAAMETAPTMETTTTTTVEATTAVETAAAMTTATATVTAAMSRISQVCEWRCHNRSHEDRDSRE